MAVVGGRGGGAVVGRAKLDDDMFSATYGDRFATGKWTPPTANTSSGGRMLRRR